MAVDIGYEATDRGSSAAEEFTYINQHPAIIAGIITSVDIWLNVGMAGGVLRVGTFYKTNGLIFKCRDNFTIPDGIPGGEKVTRDVNITVEIGDYIGVYFAAGRMERDTAGFEDYWYINEEQIDPGDEATYTRSIDDALSFGGYITEAPPAKPPTFRLDPKPRTRARFYPNLQLG